MTIAELKNHVFEALKVPVKDQRLLLTGRPLCGNYIFNYFILQLLYSIYNIYLSWLNIINKG